MSYYFRTILNLSMKFLKQWSSYRYLRQVLAYLWLPAVSVKALDIIKPNLTAVNYHFTRKCNYKCGFCFHTAKSSHKEPLENAKKILRELRNEGCLKINFAGGEPLLKEYHDYMGALVKYCKVDLCYESVSIISNASQITEEWFEKYGEYLDILGISCDAIDETINQKIGRGKGMHVANVRRVAALTKKFNIKFKLNTVVNKYNAHEDMTDFVQEIGPFRWKIFQVLKLDGENAGDDAKRQVEEFLISDNEFQQYIDRHQSLSDIMKVEGNSVMRSSYVLVDEYGRFLDSSTGGKIPTYSILDVGVKEAYQQLLASEGGGFDSKAFYARDGDYRANWSKSSSCGGSAKVEDIEDLH